MMHVASGVERSAAKGKRENLKFVLVDAHRVRTQGPDALQRQQPRASASWWPSPAVNPIRDNLVKTSAQRLKQPGQPRRSLLTALGMDVSVEGRINEGVEVASPGCPEECVDHLALLSKITIWRCYVVGHERAPLVRRWQGVEHNEEGETGEVSQQMNDAARPPAWRRSREQPPGWGQAHC
jgi:hypothetical protein